MDDETLKLLQSVGIIVALIFTTYQLYRLRHEFTRQRYLEVDRRYVDFLKQAMSMDSLDPPVGYEQSRLQHFLAHGGTKKEVLLYDLLFSTWEAAFLLYGTRSRRQWQGWREWIESFFINYPRCHLAWEIAGKYFDKQFVDYIDSQVIQLLDPRASQVFPETPEAWSKLSAISNVSGLTIGGFQVMQEWEEPLMKAMATAVGRPGINILEVGYGLGMCSAAIQDMGVAKHTILEPHPTVFARLKKWAADHPSVEAVNETWESWHPNVPDQSFDSIVFDTYPLRRSELHKNHFPFFPVAARILKPEGLFTYYSDEATHVCPEHQILLLQHFASFRVFSVPLNPPEECEYWAAPSMLVIVATKPKPQVTV